MRLFNQTAISPHQCIFTPCQVQSRVNKIVRTYRRTIQEGSTRKALHPHRTRRIRQIVRFSENRVRSAFPHEPFCDNETQSYIKFNRRINGFRTSEMRSSIKRHFDTIQLDSARKLIIHSTRQRSPCPTDKSPTRISQRKMRYPYKTSPEDHQTDLHGAHQAQPGLVSEQIDKKRIFSIVPSPFLFSFFPMALREIGAIGCSRLRYSRRV